jgi:transposase-like protein
MDVRRAAIIGAATVAVAGGGGAAIAAMSDDDGKKAEDSIIANAAKKLDVEPGELRGALSDAEDAQLDEAVRNGDLTRKQADAMKRERRRSGRVLGHPGGPHRGFGPGGPGGPGRLGRRGGPLADVAKALGISRRALFSRLRDGKSVADVARAEGKSLSEVRASVKAAAKRRLDRAVEREDLTRKQADAILEHLDEHLDRLGERGFPGQRRGIGPGPGGPPPPGFAPGGPPPR